MQGHKALMQVKMFQCSEFQQFTFITIINKPFFFWKMNIYEIDKETPNITASREIPYP